jgi:hypothetical protein
LIASSYPPLPISTPCNPPTNKSISHTHTHDLQRPKNLTQKQVSNVLGHGQHRSTLYSTPVECITQPKA